MDKAQIIARLPYAPPFLFVDELESLSPEGVKGNFRFLKDLGFYEGHFKKNPVTPGVILTECCAQIGVVSLGIYLLGIDKSADPQLENIGIGLSSSSMEFLKPVFPGERVTVISEKLYFRFHKLKCRVKMYDEAGDMVCKGEIAGMIRSANDA